MNKSSHKHASYDFSPLKDFANKANQEIGNFRIEFILSPEKMQRNDYEISNLNWNCINFGNKNEENKIPNERGIYAFVIGHPNDILPPHGHVIYIGIAGKQSKRSIRKRYKDYLNRRAILNKRPKLALAFGIWHDVLQFYFAPVKDDVSSKNLEKLEKQLNTALMPPCSTRDLEAETRRMRGAFP